MRDSRETDEVLVCMAQRLQSQVERQLTLVARLYATGAEDALPDLAEMRTTLQRSLRGVENLLVLGGAQQGPRNRGPRSVADLLADARAGVDDTARVDLHPAPDAGVAPRAVAGLLALFTELITHELAVSPGGGAVEVTSRRAEDGGLIVEVATDSPGPAATELDELNRRLTERPIIDDIVSNRVGLFVAARMAARSGAGLRVQLRRGSGHVVVVHCPPALLDPAPLDAVGAGQARAWRPSPSPGGNGRNGNGNGRGGNGGGGNGNGSGHGTGYGTGYGAQDTGPHPQGGSSELPEARLGDLLRDPLRDPLRRPDPLVDPLPLLPPVDREPAGWDAVPLEAEEPPRPAADAPSYESPYGSPSYEPGTSYDSTPPYGSPPSREPSYAFEPEPRYEPRPSFEAEPRLEHEPERYRPAVDELFGPLTSAQRDSMRDSGPTPIYEAVASAWFADDAPGGPAATEWDSPQDPEWRAASERAARPAPDQEASTAAGLPRRRPGTQMVAPPRRGAPPPPAAPLEREPERVRERLAVYQQGLQRGRHRAGDTDLE